MFVSVCVNWKKENKRRLELGNSSIGSRLAGLDHQAVSFLSDNTIVEDRAASFL